MIGLVLPISANATEVGTIGITIDASDLNTNPGEIEGDEPETGGETKPEDKPTVIPDKPETTPPTSKPDKDDTEKRELDYITVDYSGGTVRVNTAINTEYVKVVAHYTNKTTSRVYSYDLNPDRASKNGSNTIQVSYHGKYTTFNVNGEGANEATEIDTGNTVTIKPLPPVTPDSINNNKVPETATQKTPSLISPNNTGDVSPNTVTSNVDGESDSDKRKSHDAIHNDLEISQELADLYWDDSQSEKALANAIPGYSGEYQSADSLDGSEEELPNTGHWLLTYWVWIFGGTALFLILLVVILLVSSKMKKSVKEL